MSTFPASRTEVAPPEWLELVRRKVDAMRYGVVQIIVHDGRVTQVECTERTRLTGPTTSRRHDTASDD